MSKLFFLLKGILELTHGLIKMANDNMSGNQSTRLPMFFGVVIGLLNRKVKTNWQITGAKAYFFAGGT